MKASHTIRPVFDDPNLVSCAGLVPTLQLAEAAGLTDLLEQHLSVDSPNAAIKASSVIGGMLAGASSIDGLDLLRQARLLTGLTEQVPTLLTGATHQDELAFIDIDDTIRDVYGYQKQAAAYGYSGVRGLNIQLASLSTPIAAPVIAAARLRRGNTGSARGVSRLLAQTVTRARSAGVCCRLMVRADSAYYGWALVGTALRAGLWFSVTARMTQAVQAAIGRIEPDAWTAIKYPKAIFDEQQQRWISDAEVPRSASPRSAPAASASGCPAGWSCAGSSGCNRRPATAASKASCSRRTGITRSSPTRA